MALTYRRLLEKHGVVSVAGSVLEALLVIATERLTGLVVDIMLPDGSGFDVAQEARAHDARLPILLITGADGHRRPVVVYEIGASYLPKPLEPRHLQLFAERATAQHRRAAQLVEEWVERYDLSAAEAVTLRLAVEGLRRENIAAVRGVSTNTVKHQIGGLLIKVGATALTEAIAKFLLELSTTW